MVKVFGEDPAFTIGGLGFAYQFSQKGAEMSQSQDSEDEFSLL